MVCPTAANPGSHTAVLLSDCRPRRARRPERARLEQDPPPQPTGALFLRCGPGCSGRPRAGRRLVRRAGRREDRCPKRLPAQIRRHQHRGALQRSTILHAQTSTLHARPRRRPTDRLVQRMLRSIVKRTQRHQSASLADRPTRSRHPIHAPSEYPVMPVAVGHLTSWLASRRSFNPQGLRVSWEEPSPGPVA